jgi:predicted transcriptional regulator
MPLEEALDKGLKDSLKVKFKERRGKLEIIADILFVAVGGAKKTEMVYKANINFSRIERYLPYLLEKGFIEHTNGEYKTTEKGKEFLHDYKNVKGQLIP